MAAFDLNSLYFLKNAAPQTTSFEEAYDPVEKGFNLGRAYNENYNKNSLQNLIAQREKEGVPYDRLSNEAAKWDLGAANNMCDERRESMEYNYKQSIAEFEQWRKNMARRICGLILQKADELGIAPEELDRVLNVAASYVVTYDEALAQWLLGQATARRNAITRANKPSNRVFNDDHKQMSSEKQKFLDFSKGTEGTQDQRDLAAAEFDRLQLLEDYIGGRYPMSTWMTGYLRGFKKAGGTYVDAINEIIKNYNPDEQPGYEYRSLRRFPELESEPALDALNGNMPSGSAASGSPVNVSVNGNNGGEGSESANSEKTFSYVKKRYNALGGYTAPIDGAHKKMGMDINAAESVNELNNILAAIEEYESVPGAKSVESLKQSAQKKKEELVKMEDEVGNNPAARLFWKNLPSRSRMADAKRFRQAGTFAAGIISTSPLSIVDNGLMVQSPDYVISESMQKAAKLINTDDGWTNFKSLLASSGNGYLSSLAKQSSAFDVVASLGNDVLRTMRPIYNELMKGRTEEERKELKSFLASTYGLPQELFKAIEDPNGSLGTAEQIRKRSHKMSSGPKNVYINGVQIKDGKETPINSSEGTVSASEWLRRRREGK